MNHSLCPPGLPSKRGLKEWDLWVGGGGREQREAEAWRPDFVGVPHQEMRLAMQGFVAIPTPGTLSQG